MSNELFNRSADLKRLREEGYCIEKVGGSLLLRDVPHVGPDGKVHFGGIVSELNASGDLTQKPSSHQVDFIGEAPCDTNGAPLKLNNQPINNKLANGMVATHRFSRKPQAGYTDYFEKLTTYANFIAAPAIAIDPSLSPKSLRSPSAEATSVFKYTETASDRAGIGEVTRRLEEDRIAIIGLGGTGSFVLDQVAKTPVREIHLFDSDVFLQHNAFRSPGAASLEELREVMPKVEYYARKYSPMRHGIFPHAVDLDKSNLDLLNNISFAFVCIDVGPPKLVIADKLESIGASFTDVGMGLDLADGSLGGVLRLTFSTPEDRSTMRSGVVPSQGGGEDDLYSTNIQVSDLNAMNALMAVIRWKKFRGFYRDLKQEHHSAYTVDTGKISLAESDE